MHYKWMHVSASGTPEDHLATLVAENTDFDTPIDEVLDEGSAAASLRKDMERGYLVDMGDMQSKYLKYSVLVPVFAEEEVKRDDDSELGQGVISKVDDE